MLELHKGIAEEAADDGAQTIGLAAVPLEELDDPKKIDAAVTPPAMAVEANVVETTGELPNNPAEATCVVPPNDAAPKACPKGRGALQGAPKNPAEGPGGKDALPAKRELVPQKTRRFQTSGLKRLRAGKVDKDGKNLM